MHKKLITACLALVAFAAMAVVPALASASPVLTENGVAVATGVKIKATNEGSIVLDTAVGPVTCTSAPLTGTLTENSGSSIAGTITTAPFTGDSPTGQCTSEWLGSLTVDTSENLPWCIKAGGKLTADTWEIRGGGCSEAARNLTFTLTGALGTCRYTRANVTGSITTLSDTKELIVGASQTFTKEEVSSSLCPSSGTLTGTWNIETDAEPATALTIS